MNPMLYGNHNENPEEENVNNYQPHVQQNPNNYQLHELLNEPENEIQVDDDS